MLWVVAVRADAPRIPGSRWPPSAARGIEPLRPMETESDRTRRIIRCDWAGANIDERREKQQQIKTPKWIAKWFPGNALLPPYSLAYPVSKKSQVSRKENDARDATIQICSTIGYGL